MRLGVLAALFGWTFACNGSVQKNRIASDRRPPAEPSLLASAADLGSPAPPTLPAPPAPPALVENKKMNGATSPDGEQHPGEIVNDDKVQARTWTQSASEVPQDIAWANVGGTWKAVTRIEVTGTADRREITRFGQGGKWLDRTVMLAPPKPIHQAPVPTPTPTPMPESTPRRRN